MKTILFAFATLFAVGAYAQQSLNPGDNLPEGKRELKNATGKTTTLVQAAGANGLLVMFSCNTCPFVIRNQPVTKKVLAYAAAHHIGVVIVNSNEGLRDGVESYEAMKKYAKEQGYAVPYVVDENSKLADLFGATHTPEVYLFDKDLKLEYKGAMNDNPGDPDGYRKMYVQDAMGAMIAGKTPDPQTTHSIGCGIKHKA